MGRGVRAALVAAAMVVVVLASLGAGARAGVRAAPPPDYERDVAPILREHCVSCHGPKEQESDLRLDSRAALLEGGMSGPVLVAGRSSDSLLVQHLDGRASPRMPHKKPPLSADQIARLAAWIDAGMPGADATPASAEAKPPGAHWAYAKPERPALPPVRNGAWVRSPIDAFVLAGLEKEGLSPSPEASRETLLRRVSLDLVGLPPTPGEIDAFLADPRPDAYARVVDRLLASPHYGERWARPWLDLARYADTNGYEKDQRRTAWKYRDWVIDALNRDLSFRDFTIEQLAGDMLPDATIEQRIATGFHRNTQLNQEGGIDVEEARFETLVDRVNTTGTVWLGTTVACAQCHNHKFDPVSQKDYFRMLAFYDNAEYSVYGQGEEVVDRWIVEPDLELPTPEQARRRDALRREADALRLEIEGRDLEAELAAFEREIEGPVPKFEVLEPVRFEAQSGASFRRLPDGSLLVSGAVKEKDAYTVTVRARAKGITAFRVEALPDPSLPQKGPGRASSGAFVVTGLTVSEKDRAVPLTRAVADGHEKRRPASAVLDHHAGTGWGVTADESAGRAHALLVQVAAPPRKKHELTFTLAFQSGWPQVQSSLGRFRLSATSARSPFGGLPVPDEVRPILDTPERERTAEQRAALLAWFRPLASSLDAPRDRLLAIQAELDEMKVLTTPVLRERAGFERPSTPLRNRGSFMSPGERVYAAVPAALGRLPDDQPANRLGLARWLVSPDNPLTARVTVNRHWETLFGRGLVGTVEDFGTQGERPSHPDLLDWLAVELVEKGWSQKALVREIVTSATYRQSSAVTPALHERDPDNRLLARGARFRVEAEMVRDVALAASGLLSPKIGGPSVYPLQPDGIWNVPYSSMKWEASTGEDLHRRSLYTFLRRSSPYPGLSTFDAPSREQCTARRVRTNTPLQALATLNDPVFVEAARALAGRMMSEGGGDAASRITWGHRLCTARRPGEADLAGLAAFYERERTRFEREPESLRALLGEDAGKPDAAPRAALTMAANVLLSLDATLTRE
jgi:cytochrome c553